MHKTDEKIREKHKNLNNNDFNDRLKILQVILGLFFIILLVHIFSIQVLNIRGYKDKGIRQRTSIQLTKRGDILDRNGIKFATDKTVYEIYAHPRDYVEKRPVEALTKILLPYMNIPENKLIEKLSDREAPVITLRKDVDKETAEKIKLLQLREISVRAKNKRYYPQGDLAAHIIGYYNKDSEYSMGIENLASEKLNYVENKETYEHARNGSIIYNFSTNPEKISQIQKGNNVTITIDSAIQHVCEKELKKVIKEKKAERGTIIVMNPKNGEILAWATYPNFNPNFYWKFLPYQMKNWALTDIYPPGSTFKIITVASAMELGKINENSLINDTGKMTIGRWRIENHDLDEHPNPGKISLEYLFKHSSNIGSINVSFLMTSNEFYSMLKKFGFGQKTRVDLSAESSGLLAKPVFWNKSRHASMGFGYGASVTAIQMISAISAIANNGVWVTPHIIKYSEEEASVKIEKRQVMSEVNAKKVSKILGKSITGGNSPLNLEKYTVAGKTGTSRKTNEKKKGYSKYVYTSAIGFLPASDPKVAIYVVVDSPKTGSDFGNTIASPVFREVALQVTRILNIEPDRN